MIAVQDNDYTLMDELKNMCSVEIFENGNRKTINKGSKEFLSIYQNLKAVFLNGYLTPALGVSIHTETTRAMKEGDWIKLNFSPAQQKGDLPFDALVFRLENCYGFNLIRQNGGQLSGRCLYFNLNNETDLKDIIKF